MSQAIQITLSSLLNPAVDMTDEQLLAEAADVYQMAVQAVEFRDYESFDACKTQAHYVSAEMAKRGLQWARPPQPNQPHTP